MSAKLVNAVLPHKMSAAQKAVLIVLAHHDLEGRCFPSIGTLRMATCLGERTVYRAIDALERDGWLTRSTQTGVGTNYNLALDKIYANPCRSGTPANKAPVPQRRKPLPERQTTPAAAAPNRSGIGSDTKTKQRALPKQNKGQLPEDWGPEPHQPGTQCAKTVADWDDERFALEIEKFRAHHNARDNRFVSWQQAWTTWVLNSRNWSNGASNSTARRGRPTSTSRDGTIAELERRRAARGNPSVAGPAGQEPLKPARGISRPALPLPD